MTKMTTRILIFAEGYAASYIKSNWYYTRKKYERIQKRTKHKIQNIKKEKKNGDFDWRTLDPEILKLSLVASVAVLRAVSSPLPCNFNELLCIGHSVLYCIESWYVIDLLYSEWYIMCITEIFIMAIIHSMRMKCHIINCCYSCWTIASSGH